MKKVRGGYSKEDVVAYARLRQSLEALEALALEYYRQAYNAKTSSQKAQTARAAEIQAAVIEAANKIRSLLGFRGMNCPPNFKRCGDECIPLSIPCDYEGLLE